MTEPLRIARFAEGRRAFFALLEGEDRVRELAGDPLVERPEPRTARPLTGLTWLPPCSPSKIVAVGCNYRAHASEIHHQVPEEPLLFLKPPSALLEPGGIIRMPRQSRRVDYEGELGVVIGRRARGVTEARALEYILGYACVNDVTARDLQEKDVQFTRSKGFDTFCPVGPCIATGLEPSRLVVETYVNGERRQSSPVGHMIFGLARLIHHISNVMTLEPGDLIATGTPSGVGPLRPGDEVAVVIEGIGRLSNRVEGPGSTTP